LFSAVKQVWSELRRRRVVKTTLAYIVGAWLLIEASSVIFPALLLPEWSVRIVIVIAVLGLPLVVVLAWIFNIEPSSDSILGREIVEDGTRMAASLPDSGGQPLLESALASVAVLPLRNLTTSDEHGFLADGIATELHSALAKVHRLRVAAHTSSFAFRDSKESVKDIAQKLNVQYVVSGGVQCLDNKMRVNITVDNAVEGMQIWSETFERELSDIFSVQQDIAMAVANAFGGARLREEIASVAGRPTENLNAWSLVQRARSYVFAFTPQALEEAISLLRKAIKLDAEYAAAHAALAFVLAEQTLNGMASDIDSSRTLAMHHSDLALALAPVDPFVLKMCGAAWAYFGAIDKSLDALRQAVRNAPFDFGAWGYLGWPLTATGKKDDLRELHEIMERIFHATPQHPGAAYWLYHRSVASSCEDKPDIALDFARQAVERNPAFPWGLLQYANALGCVGDPQAADKAASRSLESSPALTLPHYETMIRMMSSSDEVADLRLAGLYRSGILKSN